MTQQSSHLQPYYLAAHGAPNAQIPSFEELGLVDAVKMASRYSRIRTLMDLSVTSPDPTMPLAEDPWREVGGLFGSIAESMTLAIGCEVEIELLRRARSVGDLPRQVIVNERFFAESQAQKIIEVAHRVVNVGFRAFALRPEWKSKVEAETVYGQLVAKPFSNEKEAFTSFGKSSTKALKDLCKSVDHIAVLDMSISLREFVVSEEWKELEEQRGKDFHRLRIESSVRAGVDATSSGIHELRNKDAQVIGKAYGSKKSDYKAGEGIDEQVALIAAGGLRRLALCLDEFSEAFLSCVEPLSQGRLSWSREKSTFSSHLGYWEDADCSCHYRPSLSI